MIQVSKLKTSSEYLKKLFIGFSHVGVIIKSG